MISSSGSSVLNVEIRELCPAPGPGESGQEHLQGLACHGRRRALFRCWSAVGREGRAPPVVPAHSPARHPHHLRQPPQYHQRQLNIKF